MIIRQHSRAPLFWIAIAACLGIYAAREIPAAPFWILQASVLSAILSFLPITRRIGILCLCLFTFWFYTQARCTFDALDLRTLLSDTRQSATVSGMISNFPVPKENYKEQKYWEFTVDVDTVEKFGERREASGQILARLDATESANVPHYGDVIRWSGFISSPQHPNNPGRFDYKRYLASKNIFFTATIDPKNVEWLARDEGDPLMKAAAVVRQAMIDRLSDNPWWPDRQLQGPALTFESRTQITSIMSAMLFGFREGISDEIQDSFRDTGTLHLFAVSGQNVAVITVILLALLQSMGLIRWRWGWILIIPVFIFCLATGMQPSAARAFVMASFLFIGWMLYRPIQPYNILGASALFLLIWDPRQLFDIGFQLSFIIVLSLMLFAVKISDLFIIIYRADPWIPDRLIGKFQKFKYALFRGFCITLGVAIAAWIGSAPLTAIYFHQFSLVTILANTLIAPLANVVIIVCGISVFAGLIYPAAGFFFNAFNSVVVQIILWIVTLLAQIPGGHFYVTVDPARWIGNVTAIHMLATDGASPTIIEHQGKTWLIDPGSENIWNFHTDPLRRSLGINQWSGIIITQQGTAQMGSLAEKLDEIPADYYAESGTSSKSKHYLKWLDANAKNKLGRQFWRAGDKIKEGHGLEYTILYPAAGIDHSRMEDDSLVMLIWLRGTTILWASSISADIEKEILASTPNLHADILYQAPNSKQSNLTSAWLEAVSPSIIIRPSSRYVKDYVITEDFIQQMEQRSIHVYELEKTGGLEILPLGKHFEIRDHTTGTKKIFLNNPIAPTVTTPPALSSSSTSSQSESPPTPHPAE